MRRTVMAIPLAALSLVVWLTPPALAQYAKSARGTISAMEASSITIKSADSNMTFTVDTSTDVVVRGGSTASRAAASAGKPGPKLAELLKVGDSVEVRYREKGGTMHATMIRAIDATAAVRAPASEDKSASSNGTVEALSGTSLTISGSTGGGGTFKQTFTVDASTKVIAVGAGTAAAASGGKIPITEVVARGDRVRVSYQPKGDSLHATEIRVTEKALKK